jgi:hypothetical protein
MHRPKFVSATLLLVLAGTTEVAGQGFKTYPGATKFTPPVTEETKKALNELPPGTQSSYYLTDDSFEKVTEFYKGFAKEYTMPLGRRGGKLPNGQEMKAAFFIFDGAKDLATSKSWAKVQRPYIGSVEMKGLVPEYHDIRDVTAITVVEKK